MDIPVSSPLAPLPTRPAGVVRLQQLARVLRRHLVLIMLFAVAAGIAAYAVGRTAPKVYTASSAITVEGDRFAIPELQGALRNEAAPDPMPWVRTEVQALTSRAMLSQLATELHLEDDPEFNPALRPPSLMDQIKDRISALVMPVLPSGPAGAPKPGPDEAVIGAVNHALMVFSDYRSLVIAISFTSQDPRRAAQVVNTLIADYIKTRASRRINANEGANANITQRIDQVRTDLAGIEERMRNLRSKGELVGVRAGSVGQQQAEELATAAAKASVDRSQLQISYDNAQAALKSGSSDRLASVLNSPTVSRLRDQEGTAARRMAELSTHYGPDYPGVRSVSAEISTARSQLSQEAARIVSSLGAQLRVARDQEADVQRQLDQARKAGVVSENSRAELDQLQQEATSRRALYQTLLERAQQTAAQPNGTETMDVRVISAAVPPGSPSGPNTKLTSLMGGAGGALLGCLIALLRIRSADGFESAAEVTDATGLPVLATIPRSLLRPGRGLLAARPRPAGPDVDAMRQIRERLRFSGRSGTPRSTVFVPVLDSPAAARVAAAFARATTAVGERVLLVEGNLKRPSLARMLGATPGGVMQVLGGGDWQEAVSRDQGGLSVLLGGPSTATGVDPLGSVHMQNLLVEACEEYDLVVMDAPPAASADTARLAQRADVVVLLVDSRTGHAALQDAVTRLGMVSRTPLVAVLVSRS